VFDSGAMPFAQCGYMGPDSPGAATFAKRFPADFIAEGLDQTRGWFYSLMAESVLLFGENAYRNVVCHGSSSTPRAGRCRAPGERA